MGAGAGAGAEAQSYFPTIEAFDTTADRYVVALGAAKRHLTVPVLASLNGEEQDYHTAFFHKFLRDGLANSAGATGYRPPCRK